MTERGRRRPAHGVEGSGLGILANRRAGELARLRQAPARGARARARALPPQPHQGQQPRDRAPPVLPRLRRRQALRRGGQGDRRAALPRPLQPLRLPRDAAARSRCCGARPTRCSSAPRSRPRATTPRRCIEILETHPRDELFQISVDELFDMAMGILYLGERHRLRLFVRRDPFGRYLSCLVFVPRDRFNTENRRRIQRHPRRRLRRDERRLHDARLGVGARAPALHALHRARPRARRPGHARGRARIVAATRSWADDLEDALTDAYGEERGNALHRRYREAFPTAYRADWVARAAVADIRRLEEMARRRSRWRSTRRSRPPAGTLRAKVFRAGPPLALSDMLPVFESLGVAVADERPYQLTPSDERQAWIYDFGLSCPGAARFDVDRDGARLHRRVPAHLARRRRARRLQPARARRRPERARGDRPARDRPLPAPGGDDVLQPLPGARARRAPRDRLAARRAVREPLRAGATRAPDGLVERDRGRDRRRRVASTRTASCAASSRSSGRCCARTTSSATGALPVVQARPVAPAAAAQAAAAVRDLRLLAAHRGRAPARRQGRARRDALVRPARGLPHRGARADEGADGQERGDRPGGREGRLRREAAAGRTRDALRARSRPATGRSSAACSTSPTTSSTTRSSRRPTSCATTRTTPTSSSPPTRGPRRSPTSPTRSPASTGSGSATPSPRAGRRATTTRRWASPRAARGSR